MSKFTMKYPPTKPEQRKIKINKDLDVYSGTLQSLLEWALANNISPVDATFEIEYGYYDDQSYNLVAEILDPTFEAQLALYEKKLAEYENWRVNNLEAIERYEQQQKAAKEEEQRKGDEKKLNRLQKEIARLSKQLQKGI